MSAAATSGGPTSAAPTRTGRPAPHTAPMTTADRLMTPPAAPHALFTHPVCSARRTRWRGAERHGERSENHEHHDRRSHRRRRRALDVEQPRPVDKRNGHDERADQDRRDHDQRGRTRSNRAALRAQIFSAVRGGNFVEQPVPQPEVGKPEQPRRGDQQQPHAEPVGRESRATNRAPTRERPGSGVSVRLHSRS